MGHRRRNRAKALLVALGLAASFVSSRSAAQGATEGKLEAAIFKKIFLFDRTLAGKDLSVLVVGEENAAIGNAFSALGLKASTVASPSADALRQTSVVFVSQQSPAVRDSCEKNKTLSITLTPALVEKGEASIGLRKKSDNTLEIMVNRKRVRLEGHDLPAELLSLASLVE